MNKIVYILLFFCFSVNGQFIIDSYKFGASYESEYQAVLDEATTQGYTLPSTADQITQNQIVADLKSAGVWSSLDALFWFKGSGDADFKKINWVTPSQKLVENGAGALTWSSTGVAGDGTNYLNGWNPTDDGSNMLAADASFMFEIVTASTGSDYILHLSGNTAIRDYSGLQYFNGTSDGNFYNISANTGHFAVDYETTSGFDFWLDGVKVDDSSVSGASLATTDYGIMAQSAGTSASDIELGYIAFAASLGTAQTDFYNSVN